MSVLHSHRIATRSTMASKSEPSTLAPETSSQPHEYPGAMDLSFLTVAMCISVFLVSLDRSIIATVRTQIRVCEMQTLPLIFLVIRRSLKLPMSSILMLILVGTAARI